MLGIVRLYGNAAALAARRAVRAWPVAFSLVLYAIIVMVTASLIGPLGQLGGLVLGLVLAACFSSYIHLISLAVKASRLGLADLRASFGARFWDVISVFFAFWIIDFVLTKVVAPAAGPNGDIVVALAGLAMAALFNPVPELLYQGESRSFQLLFESGRFFSKHGLEWLLPNVLAAALLMAPLGLLHGPAGQVMLNIANILSPRNDGMGVLALFQRAPTYLQLPMLLFVHWLMMFRGLLFAELTRGSARQRAAQGGWGR